MMTPSELYDRLAELVLAELNRLAAAGQLDPETDAVRIVCIQREPEVGGYSSSAGTICYDMEVFAAALACECEEMAAELKQEYGLVPCAPVVPISIGPIGEG